MPKYIEEHDPMPSQPEAEGERQKFPRFTMTGIGLTIQADVGGANIAFERLVDATCDKAEVDEQLDMLMSCIHRQKARTTVRKLLLDLSEAQLSIDALPEKKRQYQLERGADRARLVASLQAAHEVSNKRGDFRMSTAQRAGLDAHDAETKIKEAEFDRKAKEADLVIPFLRGEIAKLRHQISGYDPVDGNPEQTLAEKYQIAAE